MANVSGAALTAQELNDFLQRGLTSRLACLDSTGRPYIVPVWHHWDGERFWVIGSEHAGWVKYLIASPSVALSIDEPETVSRAHCQGVARYIEGPSLEGDWVGIALKMAKRYLGSDAIPDYQANTAGMLRWLFAIEVDRMTSWRGASRTD